MKRKYSIFTLLTVFCLCYLFQTGCAVDYDEEIIGKWKYIIPLEDYAAYGLSGTYPAFEEYGFTMENRCYYKLYQFGEGTSKGTTLQYWIGEYTTSDNKISVTLETCTATPPNCFYTADPVILDVDIDRKDLSIMTINNHFNSRTNDFFAIQ